MLKGEGTLNLTPPLAFTEEFRQPQGEEIAAGKTLEIPLKSLTSGFRGAARFSYWTEPGDHELVAKFVTAVSPAPKGSQEAMDGFGKVVLTSAPLKLTVEAKK